MPRVFQSNRSGLANWSSSSIGARWMCHVYVWTELSSDTTLVHSRNSYIHFCISRSYECYWRGIAWNIVRLFCQICQTRSFVTGDADKIPTNLSSLRHFLYDLIYEQYYMSIFLKYTTKCVLLFYDKVLKFKISRLHAQHNNYLFNFSHTVKK